MRGLECCGLRITDVDCHRARAGVSGDEWYEYQTPVSNKLSNQLKPWVETATFSDFIPIALELLPNKQGYLRVPTKFYEKYTSSLRSPSRRRSF